MINLSSQQLASINQIQFRFCDPQLGEKYNANTLFSFLFDIEAPKGSNNIDLNSVTIVNIPHDVMLRIRKTLLTVMSTECSDANERENLPRWCESFIFMDSRGRRLRNSSNIRDVILETVNAKETHLSILIDSSACQTTITAPPKTKTVFDSRSVSGAKSPLLRRPPLAPTYSMSPSKAYTSIRVGNSTPTKQIKAVGYYRKAPNDIMTVDGEDDRSEFMKVDSPSLSTKEWSFLDGLIDESVGADVLILAEPEDYSPFLGVTDDDGLLPAMIAGSIESRDDENGSKDHDMKVSDDDIIADDGIDEKDTHCFLLPSFFDETTSLIATSKEGFCFEDCSSLFNEHERDMLDILQSVMDVVDDTIMDVCD